MESEVFERIRDYLADQLDIEAEKITHQNINTFGRLNFGKDFFQCSRFKYIILV